MTEATNACDMCEHSWHGLRCEREVYDAKYLPYKCNCPPQWRGENEVVQT